MSTGKKIFISFGFCYFLAVESVDALTLDKLTPSHTQHILELKPTPAASYRVASLQFLPDFTDSEFGWNSFSVSHDYSTQGGCSAEEYPLSSCPSHGICKQCNLVSMFRLTGCDNGYSKNSDGMSCVPLDCKEINLSYSNSVDDGKRCTIVKESGATCYKDCSAVACSTYSLASCPENAECEACPDCLTNSTISGNCQTEKLKILGCKETGQKVNAGATACIDKSDICEKGFKEADCESGVEEQIGQTEAGTMCFTCKADYILKGAPILYSDMTTSTEVISGKTPIGVVFDETRKLAIALKEEEKAWAGSYFDIDSVDNYYSSSTAVDHVDGKNDTKEIIAYCEGNSKSCPAAEYAAVYTTAGTSAGSWYLPSMGELETVYKNKDALNATLALINGKNLSTIYWSSTEHAHQEAWTMTFGYVSVATSLYKDFARAIRPIINYDEFTSGLPILYSDKTTSKGIIIGKTPIGIVFDEDKKLAVALEEKSGYWTRYYADVPGLENIASPETAKADWEGKSNTATVLGYGAADNYPAFKIVNTYSTEGTNAGDWYLPGAGELYAIYQNKEAMADSLLKINEGAALAASIYWGSFWSSSEISTGNAWALNFSSGSFDGKSKMNSSNGILPIIKYSSTIIDDPILPLPTTCGTGMRSLVCSGKDYCCPSSILNCEQMNSGTFKCFTSAAEL